MNAPLKPTGSEADSEFDVPAHVQVAAARTEDEILLRQFLGVAIPAARGERIVPAESEAIAGTVSERVARRIFDTVASSRNTMTRGGLREVLEDKIQHAIERHCRSRSVSPLNLNARLTRALAEAIREAIPQDLLQEYLSQSIAVAVDIRTHEPNQFIHMNISIGTNPYDLAIDMSHPFWVRNTFANAAELDAALQRIPPREAGITFTSLSTPPYRLHPNYRITASTAHAIASTSINLIAIARKRGSLQENLHFPSGASAECTVDLDELIQAKIGNDAPPSLRNRYVAELDSVDLTGLLRHRSASGEFIYWEKFVEADGHAPDEIVNVGGTQMRLDDYVVMRIAHRLNGGVLGALGQTSLQLHEIQADAQLQRDNQRALVEKLNASGDNHAGAALAVSILQKHAEIRDVLKSPDEEELEEKLEEAEGKVYLLKLLEKLEKAPVPTGEVGYDALHTKLEQIRTQANSISGSSVGVRIAVGNSPIEDVYIVQETARSTAARSIPDHAAALAWLEEKRKETEKKAEQFAEIEKLAKPIDRFLRSKNVTNLAICGLFNAAGVTQYGGFTLQLDIKGLCDEVRRNQDLEGKTEEELGKKRDEYKEKLESVRGGKNGGPAGNAAQHLVVKAYLKKYHNLNDADAEKGTNYLLARSYLDGEMTHATEEMVEEAFGREDDWWETSYLKNFANVSLSPYFRSRRIVGHIAEAAGVPVRWTAGGIRHLFAMHGQVQRIDWEAVPSHRNLVRAYFAMKKVIETGEPKNLLPQKTATLVQHMKRVGRLLSENYTYELLRDFESGMTPEEKKLLPKLKVSKKDAVQFIEKKLRGDPPEAYGDEIGHVIYEANRRMDWWRRSLFGGKNYGLIKGEKNKASAMNLLYGNTYASAAGIYYRMPVKAVKGAAKGVAAAGKGVWERRRGIMVGTALGTILLPGLGTLIGAAAGGIWSKGERKNGGDGSH